MNMERGIYKDDYIPVDKMQWYSLQMFMSTSQSQVQFLSSVHLQKPGGSLGAGHRENWPAVYETYM